MDPILTLGLFAFLCGILFLFSVGFVLYCMMATLECMDKTVSVMGINCSNCTKSRQIPVNSPKTIPQSESFYSLDIFPDESASLSSLESTVRNMDKSTTASL